VAAKNMNVMPTHRRILLLYTGLLAALGGALINLAPLAALWRTSWPYGLLFTLLGLGQLATAGAVLVRPIRQRMQIAAAVAAAVVVLWTLVRLHVLTGPNPWTPASSVIGFTGHLEVALQAIAAFVLMALALYGPRPRPARVRRVLATVAVLPLSLVVLIFAGLGVTAASDGLAGAGFPGGTVGPRALPAGAKSTVEYCRPDGIRLAMDIYTPAAPQTRHPAPVVLYIHGGGMVLGDRQLTGFGTTIASHETALFTPLRGELNARGFVVASIDYRLLPAASWPAPLDDAKCALEFLRAHATDLGIDAQRIGVWGGSAGGQLSALLGLTAGVQAVVDMYGPSDFNDFADASPFGRFIVQIGLGGSPAVRRSASPITYVHTGAPPFLILHGILDDGIPIRQSRTFAERLRADGVPVKLIEVQGAGHSVATPGQRPSPEELTGIVADFFTQTLRAGPQP
jgi:acetyl esterase/lipase